MTSPLTLDFIRFDYAKLLGELERTNHQIQRSAYDLSDYAPQPLADLANFELGPSKIEGTGVIAKRHLAPADFIGMMNVEGRRTPLGRGTNHSPLRNAFALKVGPSLMLYARAHIAAGDEITVDYRKMPAVKMALALFKH